jgi:hypothetical protein
MKKLLVLLAAFFGLAFGSVDISAPSYPVSVEQAAPTVHENAAATILAELPRLKFSIGAPAYATEINTDVGCDSSGAWTPGTGWSVTGSKCVASSATRMAMLMQMNNAIKNGHRYKVSFDLTGYTGGILRPFFGIKMGTAPNGALVTAASVTPIADNFTTSLGLDASAVFHSTTGPGDDNEQNGSWRITCLDGGFARVDPLVYPGMQAPHLHQFLGASNIQNNWTYFDFRTKAQSSCNNLADPQHTINRSAYWAPAVIDGHGRPERVWGPVLIYYKGPASTSAPESINIVGSINGSVLTVTSVGVASPITPDGVVINGAGIPTNTVILQQTSGTAGGAGTYSLDRSLPTPVGSETIVLTSPYKSMFSNVAGTVASMCSQTSVTTNCQNVPAGLRFTFGYKAICNTNPDPSTCLGPSDTSATTAGTDTTERTSMNGISGTWVCGGAPNGVGGSPGSDYTPTYSSLKALIDDGRCNIVGSMVLRAINFPVCWDGVYVDTVNHRDHMSFGNTHGSPCLSAHPVRLPAIQMLMKYRVDEDLVAGKWHLSSDEMAACYDTAGINGCTDHADYWEAWSPTVRDDWYNHCNLAHNSCTGDFGTGRLKEPDAQWGGINSELVNHTAAAENYGMSQDITANGSYTFYITSVDDGVWGFLGMKNFTGSIDNIHVIDLGPAAKGPVTVGQAAPANDNMEMAANDNFGATELTHFSLKLRR